MGHLYRGSCLVCAGCLTADGARLRACAYKVDGTPYCRPTALCSACYAKAGGLRGLHGDKCRDGAAAMQAAEDARRVRLAAGEMFVCSAVSGDNWHVPAGLVGVKFRGKDGAETWRIMPADVYRPVNRGKGPDAALSDFPDAEPWPGNPDAREPVSA